MDTDVIKEDKLCNNCSIVLNSRQLKFCSNNCKKEFKKHNHLRTCKDCGKTPTEIEFGAHPHTHDKLSVVCKPCNRLRVNMRNAARSPEERLLISARQKTEAYKSSVLINKYGISLKDYEIMLSKQSNACKICLGIFDTSNITQIDHNHATGKVRGLLCRNCNFGLGSFHDSIEKLLLAIEYIKVTQQSNHIKQISDLFFYEGEKRIDLRYMRHIKMSYDGRLRLLHFQDSQCALCFKDLSNLPFTKMNIDHDHYRGHVRGILCKACNTGIGSFHEDEVKFNAAIEYLQTTSD